jgi:multicomponent Na+:H+ antiporter subunit F
MHEVMLHYLTGVLCFLGVGIVFCLIRAIRGPRYTDRIVALNVICTLVILIICILSYVLELDYLLDVAILYGLLNLLAIAVLSRITIGHHRKKKGRRT